MEVNFTIINHVAREKLGLSWMEYGLADLLYNLSANNSGDYPGWCYASKETLAKTLGISRRGIFNMLSSLEKKGLIERNEITQHIRTTKAWYTNVIIKNSAENALPVQNLHRGSAKNALGVVQNLHTTMISNNDKNNDTKTIDIVLGGKPPEKVKTDYRNADVQEGILLLRELNGGSAIKEQLNRYALNRLYRDRGGKERVLQVFRWARSQRQEDQYCPRVSNFMDLEERWSNLEDYALRLRKGGGNGTRKPKLTIISPDPDWQAT